MAEKHKIKVIKKGTVKAEAAVPETKPAAKRVAAREMVSTVSNWVNDFQQRKRDETKLAIEQLFGHRPHPNES